MNLGDRGPKAKRSDLATFMSSGRQTEGGGEQQRCVEGFYFGKAVQKNIQPNGAVKRETQILSIKKKKNLDQPTSSEEGRRPRPGGVTASQADGWPPVGKAISLSALQRKTGRSQGWSGSG